MSSNQSKKAALDAVKMLALAVCVILAALAAVGCAYVLAGNNGPAYTVVTIVDLLALVAGFIYIAMDFKKKGFMFLRIFMLLSSLSVLTLIAATCSNDDNILGPLFAIFIALDVIMACNFAILSIGKDLGLAVSLILCVFNLAYSIYLTCMAEVLVGKLVLFEAVAVSAIALVTTITKYADKAQRHMDDNK